MSNKKKHKTARKNKHLNEEKAAAVSEVTTDIPSEGETPADGITAIVAEPEQASLIEESPDAVRISEDSAPVKERTESPDVPASEEEDSHPVVVAAVVEEISSTEPVPAEPVDAEIVPEDMTEETPPPDEAPLIEAETAEEIEIPSPEEIIEEEMLSTEEKPEELAKAVETKESEKAEKPKKSKKTKISKETRVSEDSGKTSPWKRVLIYACLILALGFAFLASNYLLLNMCYGTINVHNGDAYNSNNVNISMFHPFPFNALEFWMDGKDISDKVQYSNSTANITMTDLPEGKHVLWIGFKKDYNPLTLVSASVCRRFDVDTEDPLITLNTPDTKLIMRKELYVMGKTEPDARYSITVNNEVHTGVSDSAGNFYAKVNMDKETNKLRIVTIDKAGNRSKIFRMFVLDETPPHIDIAELPKEESYDDNGEEGIEKKTDENAKKTNVLHDNDITLKAEVFDTGSGMKDCYFEVDGEKMKGEYNPENRNITIDLKDLDEGEYTVKVFAEDQAGWKSQKEWSFIVDSREEPGNFKIRPGAIGRDVEIVQGKLKKMGYLDEVTGTFGKETVDAVKKVQKKMNLPITGIIDKETFLAISEKINVYLGDFTLQLLSPDGKLIKKYPIACGSPYYPTPPGDYFVREKVYYPAWYPPPSPWAKGAKPIPPGPGNPLGTRWIGLNAEIVGIHGTPSSWSIGSASSHGCIRMYISDVEELFELVSVGTPVSIYSHESPREKEKELKKPGQKDGGNNTGGHEAGMENNI